MKGPGQWAWETVQCHFPWWEVHQGEPSSRGTSRKGTGAQTAHFGYEVFSSNTEVGLCPFPLWEEAASLFLILLATQCTKLLSTAI